MKRIVLIPVIIIAFLTMSFTTAWWYCHPNGDMYPCLHRVHAYDYDAWGNTYACGHKVHAYDVYPCIHYCW